MSNSFYTYIYLDPRKPGPYSYGDYTFDYEPFYVGKGHGNQHISHLRESKNKFRDDLKIVNRQKFNLIKDILLEGKVPVIIKYEQNLNKREVTII